MTVHVTAFVHPTAIVEPGADVGEDCRIWHHCHLRTGARVGARTSLGMNVFVDEGALVGDECKVQNNVSIYRGVTLEDLVFVGPSAVFTNDLNPRAERSDWVPLPTLVKRGASIGANATILCGITIGSFALVGAGAVVVENVGPHELVVGNPARRLGWVCACGQEIQRGGNALSAAACQSCGRTTQPGS
jgi:UDP-2-acetamido-3-amino-2,3-dideoxy-glucuronate N-acetyltransferase